MAKGRTRRTVWLIVVSILTLAIAGLFGAVVRQSWVNNSAAAEIVERETHGAEMLHPTTTLIAELVELRSAAVRGARVVPDDMRKALAEITEYDQKFGAELQTSARLRELTSQIDATLARPVTGREAYESYSVLVTLAVALEQRIGDTSHLVHDPDLDSYYLMEAAIKHLPQAMVYAGSASDLAALALAPDLEGDEAIKAQVARFGVATAAEAVTSGLRTSVEFTERSDLGSNITTRLDAFKAAVADFAPPSAISPEEGPVDTERLAANANRVFAAANPLAHRLLSELEALLEQRGERLAGEWTYTATAAGSAALIAVGLIWLLAAIRPRAGAPAANEHGDEEPSIGSFAYARELLDSEELVHVGRGVRSRGRGDAL